jgi:hypothetical protein
MIRHELTNTIKMILEVILIAGASIAKPLLLSYIFDIYIPEKDYARCTYAVGWRMLKRVDSRVGGAGFNARSSHTISSFQVCIIFNLRPCTAVIGVVVMMLAGAQMKYRMVNDNPSGGSFVPMMTKNLTLKAWEILT